MMEASSPLASMQPPFLRHGHFGFCADAAPSYASLAVKNFGQNNFNFRDLSMRKSQTDYFSMDPIRGSSPTASLAADLSQNFHIDKSPALPTPRRALFSAGFYSGSNGRGTVTTPPVPSSSPAQHSDMMDISPLPHKPRFGLSCEVQLQSPTPGLTPTDSSLMSISSPPSDILPEPPSLTLPRVLERRRSGPQRPLLSRTKGLSTSNIPQKPITESQLPAFRFGSELSKPITSSQLSLGEAFDDSPPQERSVLRAGLAMGPPRSRLPFTLGNSRNGSPVANHVRKSSNPLVRPRKQFRRSLSMFEHPEDIMNQDKPTVIAPSLPAILDVEVPQAPKLPHFSSADEVGGLPRISQETMIGVLDGHFDHLYEKRVVIDCRFEYEYQGGHIDGAVNFNDKEQLASHLFDVEPTSKALLILHCEYSAHRAPLMAKFIRNKDRTVNADHYPNLTYPEIYILDGGYNAFFKDHQSRCFPQNYVEMDAKEHEQACERGMGKVKQRQKLMRAQTFAFGQQSSPSMDSSPTCRGRMDIDVDMDMGTTLQAPALPAYQLHRFQAKRMGSY